MDKSKTYRLRGTSLIEILVSLFILSIILLSITSLRYKTLQDTLANFYLFTATQQMLNANNPNHAEWQQQISLLLPQGHGVITTNSIDIFWGGYKKSCTETVLGKSGCLHSEVIT